MENNQEHKIDIIFKQSLDNQLVTPPSDAWMSIHTYTVGQEESKRKVWFRYASLALLFLLFSSIGFWYFVDNQYSTSMLLMQKVVSGNTDHGGKMYENEGLFVKAQTTTGKQTTSLENAGRVSNPASVKILNQLARISENYININMKTNEQTQDLNFHEALVQIPIIENQALIVEDNLTNQNIELIEPVSYLPENNLEIIKSKPLTFIDLIDKIQKENENTIVALEENMFDKKEVFKVDSVDYRSRFSFRHPIISYGLEISNSNWDVMRNIGNNNWVKSDNSYKGEPMRLGYSLKLGISWKVNKRLRSGIKLSYGSTDLGNSSSIKIPNSSNSKLVFDYAIKNNSNTYYNVSTSFGDLEIPYYLFNNPSFIQKDSSKIPIWFSPHSMKSFEVTFSNQYDLISKKHKRGRKYYYQVYGLLDLNILRQTEYSFRSTDAFFLLASSANPVNTYRIMKDFGHLQNASEFIFGLRTGLGFRYQFARKWDFFVEGSGQHSLNNWVKSGDIKTFQRAISLQAGINLNL